MALKYIYLFTETHTVHKPNNLLRKKYQNLFKTTHPLTRIGLIPYLQNIIESLPLIHQNINNILYSCFFMALVFQYFSRDTNWDNQNERITILLDFVFYYSHFGAIFGKAPSIIRVKKIVLVFGRFAWNGEFIN